MTFSITGAEMNYFDVFPDVVPADKTSEIRVKPRYEHAKFGAASELGVQYYPYDGLRPDGTYENFSWQKNTHPTPEWRMEGDTLVIKMCFAGEQEHLLLVNTMKDGVVVRKREFHVYSLGEDLLKLRPFKGDFHIHTMRSDGKETPCYVAARYRQKGFDFIALSDHRDYAPSVEAIEYWKPYDLDFRLYPGEEVHTTDNPVHIINFAGKSSVNKLCRDDDEKYRKEVAKIEKSITGKKEGVNYFEVAASEWAFEKIREAEGLAVFCHPYWYCAQFVINEGLIGEMFRRRKFDAFELLGGFYKYQYESNNFQVIRYFEEQAKGNRFPVVGLSDSHGTDIFRKTWAGDRTEEVNSRDADLAGWYYTVILAESNSAEDLIAGVKDFRSVAVSEISGGQPQIYGEFRIVRYVSFLMREYFPLHAHYCAEEGALMLDCLAGDKAAGKALKALKGRVGGYREDFFGRK